MKKKKKLKKTWRKMRKSVIHRLAACQDGAVTILSEFNWGWYAGEKPPPHISHLDIHNPDLTIGLYVEGPIYKGFRRGRAFIDLCTDKAWTIIDQKGKTLLDKEFKTIALHPGILEPITRSAGHKLRELI